MAIGERIRFIRNLRGMTQKYLGTLVGFPEKTADVRMAQYEAGTRTPKEDLTKALAGALDVSPLALNVPDIDSYFGLMHTLFALEDRRLIRILPSYLLCVLPMFVLSCVQGRYGTALDAIKDLAAHLTFTHNLFSFSYFSSHIFPIHQI